MLARTSEPDGSLVSNRMPGAMLARKPNRRVELVDMARTVESLTAEIGRIVAERQELRATGASFDVLEENRRRLAKAQSELSQLLIARYLPSSQPVSRLRACFSACLGMTDVAIAVALTAKSTSRAKERLRWQHRISSTASSRGPTPSKLAGMSNSYLFDIEGEGQWLVDVRDGAVTVTEGGGDADADDHHLGGDIREDRRGRAEPDDRVHDRQAEDQGRHGRGHEAPEDLLRRSSRTA